MGSVGFAIVRRSRIWEMAMNAQRTRSAEPTALSSNRNTVSGQR